MKITKIYLLTLLLILFNLSASAWTSLTSSTSDWVTTQSAGIGGPGLDVDEPSAFDADLDAYIAEENAFRLKLVNEGIENQTNIASNATAISTANDSLVSAQSVEANAQVLLTAAAAATNAKQSFLTEMDDAKNAASQNVLDIATADPTIDPDDSNTHTAIYSDALVDETNAIAAFDAASTDYSEAVDLESAADDGLLAAAAAVVDVNSTINDLLNTASSLSDRTSILNNEIANIDNRVSEVANTKATLETMLQLEVAEHQGIINTIGAFMDSDYSDDLDALIEYVDDYDTYDPLVDTVDDVDTTLSGTVLDHTNDDNLTNEVISTYAPSVTTADLISDYQSHLDSVTSLLSDADQTSLIQTMSNGAWEREAVTSNYSNITSNTSEISTNASGISTNADGIADNSTIIGDNFNSITTQNGLITGNTNNITAMTTNGIADIITVEEDGSIHIGENSFVTNQVNDLAGVGGQQDIYGTDINGDSIDLNVSNGSGLSIAGEAVATEAYADNADSVLSGLISTNAGDISTNAGDISTNASGISTNFGLITDNAGDISTNVADISTNAGDISTNAGLITDNAGDISTNVAGISTNAGAISTNAGAISTNVADISTNVADISTNAGDISTNASGIATNVADIATNVADISDNAGDISTNAGDISTNVGAISTNAGAISTNAGAISTNVADISTNVADISTNAGAISTNAGAISTNAGGIATNASNISANSAEISTNRKGIAMAAAITHSTLLPGNTQALDLSFASFEGESAFALNYARKVSEGVQVNVSTATSDGASIFKGSIGWQW